MFKCLVLIVAVLSAALPGGGDPGCIKGSAPGIDGIEKRSCTDTAPEIDVIVKRSAPEKGWFPWTIWFTAPKNV